MEYQTLTAEQQLNIVRGRLQADEASHYSLTIDDAANGTDNNEAQITQLTRRIQYLKQAEAELQAQLPKDGQ